MFLEEFPHEVEILTPGKSTPDGGGGYTPGEPRTFASFQGFLDTPTSREIYEAEQRQHPFDRYLYYPYRTDIQTDMLVVCENDTYEIVGKPLDQGGQHEIMRVALRLVNA